MPSASTASSASLRFMILLRCLAVVFLTVFFVNSAAAQTREYLWYEAENMRGFTTGKLGEPILNPSYLLLTKDKAPGWGMNGPGVSAEWSQGGESEWSSAAASADETNGSIYQDLEIPAAGDYKFWIRYADWANATENFTVTIAQNGAEVFTHEFGAKDVVDPHDEVSMYWRWAFTWDQATASLKKGPARVTISVTKSAQARRHVDCFVITNDTDYRPQGRQKPDFAAARYLRNWSNGNRSLTSLIANSESKVPASWLRPKVAGRDFLMPWNIAREYWSLYDKPAVDKPLYPFNSELVDQFVQKYKGQQDVPLFKSKLVAPVVHINDIGEYLKEGSPFLRYLRETKSPFAILINYGGATFNEQDGPAALQLLKGEFKDQFLGWISGESVGYVWDAAPAELKISPSMSRRELLEAHRQFYTNAIAKKWQAMFHADTGAMWDKLIPAQSTSSTSFAHALSNWGVNLLGMETAAVMPMTGMRIAFTRGAVRQNGGAFLYYHAPNFGDTASTFTKTMNFAGPDFFFHTRYGPSMGPSLSWYRKNYFLYYMSGASAIYLEQGGDQFFKPGPGEHPFQLNPLGRITEEFMNFAERHPDRGTPYTPIAFLLDPAHGFEMTDYPQWPFETSQIDRSDRAIRELMGVAYSPGLVVEGEPAIADRQPFVSGLFGDIFDVVTAESSPKSKARDPLTGYRAVVVGGRVEWSNEWIQRLNDYVRNGGTLIVNASQTRGLPEQLTGVRFTNATAEADSARCAVDAGADLNGQLFRYEKVELKSAVTLISGANGDPLVTTNKVGKGTVIFIAIPDLLGVDERMTPVAAHLLTHVFTSATPVRVSGDVEYLVNQTASGWVVTMLNNNGVSKPQQGMATVDRNAYVNVTITTSEKVQSASEWIVDKVLEVKTLNGQTTVTLQIAPGGIAVVELKTKS